MPLFYSIPLFLASLAVVVAGSMFLSRALSRLGLRLSIPEQFLGFITALGADSPEISSTVVAMLLGQTDVAVGVVFGSNLFNLATLLGLSAVIAGRISLRRDAVLLDGSVGILVTALGAALVLGVAPPWLIAGLVLLIMAPYALLLALRRDSLERLPLPASWKPFLISAASESQEDARKIQQTSDEDEARRATSHEVGQRPKSRQHDSTAKLSCLILGALVVIILGSTGLVRSATWLTKGWLPRGLLGTLVLAALTGIPNLYTAASLALRQRGSAVMTETMNSNSLNILVGLVIPSLVFGHLRAHSAGGYLDTAWLFVMSLVVVGLLAARQRLSRRNGIVVIAAYLLFVAFRIYLALPELA